MSTHTVGPWTAGHPRPEGGKGWTIWAGRKAIASVHASRGDGNALLIAAAPDLLEASEAFLAWFKEFDGKDVFDQINHPTLDALRAAIARAKGEA